jgi:alcohol dehydrogenase (cytochrome c)
VVAHSPLRTGRLSKVTPFLAAALLWGTALPLPAQTTRDLASDESTPGDVLTYGMGYGQQRYSPLTQIDRKSVKRLVPVWSISTNNLLGDEAQPLLANGLLYYTTGRSTYAIDAVSGRLRWKHDLNYAPDVAQVTTSGQVNRGVALYDGMVFRTTLDAQVLALDAITGKEIWRSRSTDYRAGYSMTVAPLVAEDVLITGISCGEYGGRGYIEGWDPHTGRSLWRRYTVPAPGEPESETWPTDDTWTRGGGAAWLTGSYDPKLGLVYWGVGNPSPWNARIRPGDNLYTSSVLALRPRTGELVWHYQFTPNDSFDFDGNNEFVLADIAVAGRRRHVLMHADRNGFLYVIDRQTGELLAANPYTNVTWAKGIDLKTGRPVESDAVRRMRATGEQITVAPSAFGGKNWSPMSFNPATGLLYANVLHNEWDYKPVTQEYVAGAPYMANESTFRFASKEGGTLQAIDPLTGRARWTHPWEIASFSGTLTTAGNLVFSGNMLGEFVAFDARTGQKLWSFQTSSGIVGQPITWERGGKQYVTVASGIGTVYLFFAGDRRLSLVPPGGSLWTFALHDSN